MKVGFVKTSRSRRVGLLVAVAAAAASMVVVTVPASAQDAASTGVTVLDADASSPSGANCKDLSFAVHQFENDSNVQQVYGQFCSRGAIGQTTPVQILIHGGSYNHAYWDWPYQPEKYSYVAAATKKGYATLNIDRLGYGRSDHPLPVTLDFRVAGYVTHQLVQYLRSGAVGPQFEKVILNGHSMGGLTAQREASAYKDVDGVIVTGVGHNFAPKGIAQVADKFYPADLDPKFLGKIPPGYLTTLPGNRAKTFVQPGDYDPGIEPVEEDLKDTLSPTELTGITLDSYDPSITRGIEAPVLYALGQHDLIWCPTTEDCNTDPQPAAEGSFYGAAAEYSSYIVPDSAHSVNVTASAPLFYDATFRWMADKGLAP
jgi:pimeloyl-ACP methyl ester carboxylesterase